MCVWTFFLWLFYMLNIGGEKWAVFMLLKGAWPGGGANMRINVQKWCFSDFGASIPKEGRATPSFLYSPGVKDRVPLSQRLLWRNTAFTSSSSSLWSFLTARSLPGSPEAGCIPILSKVHYFHMKSHLDFSVSICFSVLRVLHRELALGSRSRHTAACTQNFHWGHVKRGISSILLLCITEMQYLFIFI